MDKDRALNASLSTLMLSKAMILNKQLRRYLERREMSASQLAKKANVPKQSLSGWLAGSNPRDVRQVKRVADVLGTTVDELMFGSSVAVNSEKSTDLDFLLGDGWISGIFEVRFRRIKK